MRSFLSSVVLFCWFQLQDTTGQHFYQTGLKHDHCQGISQTALVEHFFNVLFTEFHNTPPVCVCVQMCQGHPTYCYPNGCLRQDLSRKKLENVSREAVVAEQGSSRETAGSPNPFMFLDDDSNELGVVSAAEVRSKKPDRGDLNFELFKDRYKSLLKYKKVPKVELHYNFREQVKNLMADKSKTDAMDFTKNRWPTRVSKNGNQFFAPMSSMASVFSENNPNDFISKYFKRNSPKQGSKDSERNKTNSILSQEFNTEVTQFSVDRLIDKMLDLSSEILNNTTKNDEETTTELAKPNRVVVRYNPRALINQSEIRTPSTTVATTDKKIEENREHTQFALDDESKEIDQYVTEQSNIYASYESNKPAVTLDNTYEGTTIHPSTEYILKASPTTKVTKKSRQHITPPRRTKPVPETLT